MPSILMFGFIQGEFVTIVNSDDWLVPTALAEIL